MEYYLWKKKKDWRKLTTSPSNTIIIELTEHCPCSEKDWDKIHSLKLKFDSSNEKIQYLNLDSTYKAGYFIGIDWLKEGEVALIVRPKIEKLDFLEMFKICYEDEMIFPYLKNTYHIYFEKQSIPTDKKIFDMTPMLALHFLKSLSKIVHKGLKKDFIQVESNLNSKIKGKILNSINIKLNHLKGRKDRNYCRYQEYSINCKENQYLKFAFKFVNRYLLKIYKDDLKIQNLLNLCKNAFSEVDEIDDLRLLKNFKINPLYKDYTESLRLAEMILKRFGYSLLEINSEQQEKLIPFYINMPLLFELYVYSLLSKNKNVKLEYQFHGKYGYPDFLELKQKIIIDAKYKPDYSGEYKIEDIRQVAGYARDVGIRKKLNIEEGKENEIVNCLIIFPDQKSENKALDNENLLESEITQFVKFYKLSVKLPA